MPELSVCVHDGGPPINILVTSNTPHPLKSLSLGMTELTAQEVGNNCLKKDWPHAPVHRLTENGVYFLTAGTLHKTKFFDTDEKKDLLEEMLLSLSKAANWQIEAWAVLSNHYHLVARGNPDSKPFGEFVVALHSKSAISVNKLDGIVGRKIWHNFRDTRLTHQYSYLARLNYVHQNAVKHGLVRGSQSLQMVLRELV